ADHLELDEIGPERLARELRRQHSILCGRAAGGVRQYLVTRAVDVVDQGLPRRIVQMNPANRDGDEFGPTRLVGALHDLERRVLARSDEQARMKFVRADLEGRVGGGG